MACVPLIAGDLPDFGGMPAGDVVAVFGANDAHALALGEAAGCGVADGFWDAHDGEARTLNQ